MTDDAIMQLTLCGLLLFSGFLCLLPLTTQEVQRRIAIPAVALLFFYSVAAAAFCLIIHSYGGMELLLPALMLLAACFMGATAFRRFSRCRSFRSLLMAVLLVLWLIAALLITLFSREQQEGVSILLKLDALKDAARLNSWDPISHFLLNMLLFLPLGVLLPLTDMELRPAFVETLAAAVFLTAAIESMQLVLRLGQVDVEDLLANVLGAMIGCLIVQCCTRRPNEA